MAEITIEGINGTSVGNDLQKIKTCSTCDATKSWDFFYKDKSKLYGLDSSCKDCRKEINRKSHIKNKETHNKVCRDYYAANKEKLIRYSVEYQRKNKEQKALRQQKYISSHPEKHCATQAERRARKFMATPKWANKFFIDEIYHLSKLRTKLTGIKWEVDHLIPLNSKLVCGLHSEDNLQVIPAVLNRQKGNRI